MRSAARYGAPEGASHAADSEKLRVGKHSRETTEVSVVSRELRIDYKERKSLREDVALSIA